jgi:hypothetical protein
MFIQAYSRARFVGYGSRDQICNASRWRDVEVKKERVQPSGEYHAIAGSSEGRFAAFNLQWYHTSKLCMFSCESFAGVIYALVGNIIYAT